ncbi:VOC family protein [Streptomyces sp. NPDC057690]|uniref:VOC family protein n=1 Tax=Streptomyces sp. NPDC057690 TaxID=3346214 RepID=UPI0036BDB328
MHQHPSSAALPGAIRQVGYVVTDLDRAVEAWLSLGVGPWYVMRGMPVHALYGSEPCQISVSIALSNSGDVQIELLQQDDETPSIYTEFLASGQEGYQQLAWWVDDLDAAVKTIVGATGWPVVWSSDDRKSPLRYAYLQPPTGHPAHVIEIMERTAATDNFAEMLRNAADVWDGNQPVRVRAPRTTT